MSMTERAMPGGELREAIAEAISAHSWTMGGVFKKPPISWDDLEEVHREAYRRWADSVIDVLRPHLGPGVTDGLNSEEWYDLESAIVDAINGYEDSDNRDMERRYEALLAKLRAQRAIAGRGEGMAEG